MSGKSTMCSFHHPQPTYSGATPSSCRRKRIWLDIKRQWTRERVGLESGQWPRGRCRSPPRVPWPAAWLLDRSSTTCICPSLPPAAAPPFPAEEFWYRADSRWAEQSNRFIDQTTVAVMQQSNYWHACSYYTRSFKQHDQSSLIWSDISTDVHRKMVPNLISQLRCFNRKIINKLCSTWHIFGLVILSSCCSRKGSPYKIEAMFTTCSPFWLHQMLFDCKK